MQGGRLAVHHSEVCFDFISGGRNGYGAKLCNIFSTKFIVETSCKEFRKSFKQVTDVYHFFGGIISLLPLCWKLKPQFSKTTWGMRIFNLRCSLILVTVRETEWRVTHWALSPNFSLTSLCWMVECIAIQVWFSIQMSVTCFIWLLSICISLSMSIYHYVIWGFVWNQPVICAIVVLWLFGKVWLSHSAACLPFFWMAKMVLTPRMIDSFETCMEQLPFSIYYWFSNVGSLCQKLFQLWFFCIADMDWQHDQDQGAHHFRIQGKRFHFRHLLPRPGQVWHDHHGQRRSGLVHPSSVWRGCNHQGRQGLP